MLAAALDDDLRLFDPPGPAPAAEAAAPPRVGRAPRRPASTLLALDGNGIAHRAFHAVGGEAAGAGEAAGRFLGLVARIAAVVRPTACVVAFDDPERSLRRERHAGYKAARPPKAAALVELLDFLPGLLEGVGLAVVVPDGLEADDVLGSAAAAATRRAVPAALATGDQDAFALVTPTVRVMFLVAGGHIEAVSPSWLRARYGVGPAAYLDFAALRGDASDCLPGIRGIGTVTAARLLAAYPSVDAALADPAGVARLLGAWVAQALVTQQGTWRRNRELMTIRTDVPLDLDAISRRLEAPTVHAVLGEHGLGEAAGRLLGAFACLGRAAWRRPLPAS